MKQEEIEQLVLDVITMTEDPNGKCVHSYDYEELARDIAERLVKKLTIPVVVGTFFCQHKLVLDCKEQCHKCKHEPNS
tara:strand:+ start:298 stop:531 length:234 start_codon:yes stop_codon:yes gene_type:complete